MAEPPASPAHVNDPNVLPTLQATPATAPLENGPPTLPYLRAREADGAFPRPFADYELLAELGRGGMGIVYKARQNGLERTVALKAIVPGHLSAEDELLRFRTEVEATARLHHPNIVAIYEVGEFQGQHFYSMELVEGPSLVKRLENGPLPGRQAAGYVATIARAIHHAHCHGVLHRDLKPGNILLDADDQPHVTDFGLAKKLGGDSSQTRTGAVMGTPSYMAPEQAAGRTKDVGPACDVYGLGAVLYELLTGRPPFHSDNPFDTMLHVLDRDPAPPRLLNPKVDHDLETICLKCLEKEPRRRYESAQALADDLDRYLKGESISARSFNVLDRLARTLDRSQYDIEFGSWGSMLLLFGVIVAACHFLTFLLIEMGQSKWMISASRVSQLVLMLAVFGHYRRRRLLPTSPAERQLWTIWIGYLVACLFSIVTHRFLIGHGVFAPGPAGPSHWDELSLYPTQTILSGLGFFVMGSSYWGRCYAVGMAFFALAFLMVLDLNWAPIEFGLAWGVTLVTLGLHLRRLGREAGTAVAPAKEGPA
jgi:serine/threonine protein kinase